MSISISDSGQGPEPGSEDKKTIKTEETTVDVDIEPKTKHYFYCNYHDDAFFTILPKDHSPYSVEHKAVCCMSTTPCPLSYIGLRTFDENNKIIIDTVPRDDYFDRKCGGYKLAYLDNASEIYFDL